jgi:dihydrofolate synthase/folylpolyglutamate synthase
MLTAIAFEYFAQNKVDIAVLEVGMGGRLDATNVIDPLVSVITDISLDHQDFLGDTVGEIANEKAGIIRPGGIVVTLPQHPQANDVIGNKILELRAKAVSAVPYVPPVSPGSDQYFKPCDSEPYPNKQSVSVPRSRYRVEVMGKEIAVESALIGRHQLRNVALAIATAEELGKQGYAVTPEAIERGISETNWPGRFQVLPAGNGAPEYVFDVAHNPAGAWALRSTLSTCYADSRLVFVFGAMRDKAIGEIAEILFPLAEAVVATRANNPRSATVEEIRQASVRVSTRVEDSADVAAAMVRASTLAGSSGIVVVTGSIYVVGEAMQAIGLRV